MARTTMPSSQRSHTKFGSASYRCENFSRFTSTPSLFINGTLYKGARSVEELDAALAKLAK